MAKKKINTNKIKGSYLMIIFVLGVFCLFVVRLSYLCVVNYGVGDSDIEAFIKNRNTEEEEILPPKELIQQYQEKRASLNADIDRILAQITEILGIDITEDEAE